jgi:dihydroorotase
MNRSIVKLNIPQIKVGEKAELTIFDPSLKWTFTEKDIKSKSKNTPFIGAEFTGKPIATIV